MQYQFNTILAQEFEMLKQEIIQKYEEKGMRASGQFIEGLEVQVSQYSASLKGYKYTEQLEYGRRPGKISFEGREKIKEWILHKNVFNAAIAKIGLNSLAFLIARKIAQKGYKREQYGGVNLVSEVVTPERIQKIIDRVGRVAIVNFVSELNLKEWQ